MQIESNKAEAIVNFVQTYEPTISQTQVRVGRHDVIVHPGQMARIKCKVPSDFTPPVALPTAYSQLRKSCKLTTQTGSMSALLTHLFLPVRRAKTQANSLSGGIHLSIFIIWTMNNKRW